MNTQPLASADEIEKIARNLLVGARAWGKLPTPVDDLIAYSELSIAKRIDLSQVEPSWIMRGRLFAGRVSRKVLGIFDFRDKTIYLDHGQPETRKGFIKLHETGHGVLPWQKDLIGCQDDETTIVPEIKDEFEREASFFASASLFQLDRFDEEAAKLPLSIDSARALAGKFGGSVQAALRRYVERSPKRCALLVFHKPKGNGSFRAKIRDYFESATFTQEFGGMTWPEECGTEFEFVKDMQRRRKYHQDGQFAHTTHDLDLLTLHYHYFDNSYNVFVLLFPPGERIVSRVKIVAPVA